MRLASRFALFEIMKRHQSLYPLSHEHHHALAQARDLEIAGAGDDQEGHQIAAARFAAFWKSDLQRHFMQEEQIVLPLLAKHTAAEGAEIRETLVQHSAITQLIAELNENLERHEAIEASLLINLAEKLRRHIQYEEGVLFPAVEASLTEEELWEMNGWLLDRRFQGDENG
jgi:hemerythrin-like domain-containing protein